MTFWALIRRNLRFHTRATLGVRLGAAIGSAALIGALVVGDSVRRSLNDMALRRLGKVHFALSTQDRLFQTNLKERVEAPLIRAYSTFRTASWNSTGVVHQASALALPGMVARQDGTARANRVNIIGVEAEQWRYLANWRRLGTDPKEGAADEVASFAFAPWEAGQTAFINETLARQLGAQEGDEIILRVRKPSALGLDAALSPRNEDTVAVRLKVGAILTPQALGDFGLAAQPTPPANLFLPLEFLAKQVGVRNQANLFVMGPVLVDKQHSRWDSLRLQLSKWCYRYLGFYWHYSSPLKPPVAIPDKAGLPWLNTRLACGWLPEDVGLSVRTVEQPQAAPGGEHIRPSIEVGSSRIFLESAVVAAALKPRSVLLTNRYEFLGGEPSDVVFPEIVTNGVRMLQTRPRRDDVAFCQFVTNGVRVLTYLADLIRAGTNATPYSMVTAADAPFVPQDMRDDEILVNQWLADDLHIQPGDAVALSYYVADSGSRLVERTNTFRVRQVVPLAGIYADRTLMPEFPGLAKAESTHDWDAGFPLVYPIRAKDEAYWRAWRGTPKAFVTLAAGQAMWANRFGSLTAIRYPVPANATAIACREAVYRNLLANLRPEDVGLRFEPVREQALKAAAQGQDFGQLFIGFSLFLVVAALLLMALLFQFGLEQRATEVGTLLALGFTPGRVRRLLLAEGTVLALVGGVYGTVGGIGYAWAMLWGLTTAWRGAVGGAELQFHVSFATLLTGLCASTVVAVVTIWLTLRKQARQPARELLAGQVESPRTKGQSKGIWMALGSGLAAVVIIAWGLLKGQRTDPGVFFGAGSLLLVAGLASASAWLSWLGRDASARRPLSPEHGRLAEASLPSTGASAPLTLSGLGVRGCARRRKRSLATVALLACGSFVIVAIGVFRLDATRDAARRDSGTGGFALIGESTLPVVHDLNTKAGRESYGLDAEDLAGVNVVPLRVRAGDEASCLNLNRAQKPRLLGVNPSLLAGRFTFSAVAKGLDPRQGWALLCSSRREEALTDDSARRAPHSAVDQSLLTAAATGVEEVLAIGDANAIQWAMGKQVGDTIDYTDERGHAFRVRLVGALANSILQGSLLIDEAEFTRRFPGESGYRMFLIDAPSNAVVQVSATISRALQDTGLELTPTARRLNEFNAVQNTYLGTFQALGGLGLLLGSAGLGVVVLRNVLERRGEMALLTAVGFRRRLLRRLVLSEHGALLGLGLAVGIAAAAVAVLPALLTPGTDMTYGSLALTLAAVLLNGLLWTWLATSYALRGNLLAALRNE